MSTVIENKYVWYCITVVLFFKMHSAVYFHETMIFITFHVIHIIVRSETKLFFLLLDI